MFIAGHGKVTTIPSGSSRPGLEEGMTILFFAVATPGLGAAAAMLFFAPARPGIKGGAATITSIDAGTGKLGSVVQKPARGRTETINFPGFLKIWSALKLHVEDRHLAGPPAFVHAPGVSFRTVQVVSSPKLISKVQFRGHEEYTAPTIRETF